MKEQFERVRECFCKELDHYSYVYVTSDYQREYYYNEDFYDEYNNGNK